MFTASSVRRSAAWLMVFLAVVLIAGCGSSSSSGSSQDPRAVVTQYISALKSGDDTTVCSLLTAEAKRRFPGGKCVQVLDQLKGLIRTELNKVKITIGQATVNGNNARVPVRFGSSQQAVRLTKATGHWLIESNPTTK